MAQSENPNPKLQLPETWAERMACPICNARPLGVFHPTGQADRFACPTCETSFELEENGKRVRFVTLPPNVTPWMRGQWVVLEEALAAFEIFKNGQSQISVVETPTLSQPVPLEPTDSAQAPVEAIVEEPVLPQEPVIPPEIKETIEKPAEISGNQHLHSTDRLTNKPSTNSPFYEEDYSVHDLFPEKEEEKKPEPETDAWKDREAERVKEALVHPPSSDFAGQLAASEAKLPDESFQKPVSGMASGIGFRYGSNSQDLGLPKVSLPPENSNSDSPPLEPIALDNPPPIRPMEDTPPTIIQPVQMRPRTIFNEPDTDMGDLRVHMSSASNAPSMNEKMEAAAERAIELHKLGNTDQEVRSILQRSSGLTPEQVAEVLKNLEKPEEQKRSNRLLLIFSVIALAIFTMLAWWFFSNRSFSSLSGSDQSTGNPISLAGKLVDATSLPAPLQTMMPNGIQILNEDPTVEQSNETTIPAASCPKTKDAAAALFGGSAADWGQDSSTNGWTLITKVQGLEIRIPANMSGGYLIFDKGPEMRGISGPAIVRNVYMIAIACQ